jgi:hypothetical protein
VNIRKKDFGLAMRIDRKWKIRQTLYSGIGPQAGRFSAMDRASLTPSMALRK